MDEVIVKCPCGRTAAVPANSTGMVYDCARCGKPVTIAQSNTREMTPAERDVRLFLEDVEPPPVLRPPAAAEPPAPQAKPVGGGADLSFQRMGDLGGLAQGRKLPSGLPSTKSEPPDQPERLGLIADDEDSEEDLKFRRMRDFEPSSPRRMAPPTLPPKEPAVASGAARAEAARFAEKEHPGGANVARCAQCQRQFRGGWDMIDTAAGTLCHICANKVENFTLGAAPERPPSGEQREFVQQIARQYSWTEPPEKPEETEAEKRRQFWLTLAGVGVIAVTLLLLVTGAGRVSPEAATAPQQLPQIPNYTYLIIRFVLHVMTTGLALYFTLYTLQKLPNRSLLANVAAMFIVAVLIHIINVLPFVGYIFGLIVIYFLYELNLFGFIVFFAFGSVAEVVTSVVAALIVKFLGLFA